MFIQYFLTMLQYHISQITWLDYYILEIIITTAGDISISSENDWINSMQKNAK